MKRLTVLLAGLGLAAAAVPSIASAAPYLPIGQRAANIDLRIDQGIRSGALNRAEAFRLKSDLRGLINLENRYRISGGRLDLRERADLDRRFDNLSRKVMIQKHDGQHRW